MNLNNWLNNIRVRLILVLIGIVFLTSLLINTFVIPTISDNIYQEKKTQVKKLVDAASGVLRHYNQLQEEGVLTKVEAQNRAKEEIKQLTYGPGGQDYFWITDHQPRMIMHPFKPELNGQDVSTVKDSEGANLFVKMVEVAEEQGSGYVEYKWQYYDNTEQIETKISYVKQFQPWNWILGTGIYVDDIQDKVASIRNKIILLTVIILFLAGGLAYFLSNYFAQPLEELTTATAQVAKGDLTQTINIDRKDEIGKLGTAVNSMVSDLREIVTGIQESVDETSSASAQLAASSQQTASSVEAVAHSAEDFNGTVQQVTDKTSAVSELGTEVDQLAHKGSEQMNNTQKEMKEIISTSQKSTQIINELRKFSQEIEEIISAISDISDQTSLLALNASIEAARAGSTMNGSQSGGQGFTVVAEEIRELSEQTQEAVDNIQTIINQLQGKTETAVEIIAENNDKIELGAEALDQTGGIFQEIVIKIDRVTNQLQDINQFSGELLESSDQISSETQDQSAAMQEIAGASEELTAMSDQLAELIAQFKVKE